MYKYGSKIWSTERFKDMFNYTHQHIHVLCESYTVQNEPDYGCTSCAVQRESHAAQHTTHNHNQAYSKQRTTHTQKHKTCCHSTKVNITK